MDTVANQNQAKKPLLPASKKSCERNDAPCSRLRILNAACQKQAKKLLTAAVGMYDTIPVRHTNIRATKRINPRILRLKAAHKPQAKKPLMPVSKHKVRDDDHVVDLPGTSFKTTPPILYEVFEHILPTWSCSEIPVYSRKKANGSYNRRCTRYEPRGIRIMHGAYQKQAKNPLLPVSKKKVSAMTSM